MNTPSTLELWIVFGPLALYLLLLGLVNLGRRPLLVSGVGDAAALALAVSGLAVLGPLQLCLPFAATLYFGAYVWLLVAALYAMSVLMWLLSLRPRIVIYNISLGELRPILAHMAVQIDKEARWAGDSLSLPTLGVHLFIDATCRTRTIALRSAGPQQRIEGWHELGTRLHAQVVRTTTSRNYQGIVMIVLAALILVGLAVALLVDPPMADLPAAALSQRLHLT